MTSSISRTRLAGGVIRFYPEKDNMYPKSFFPQTQICPLREPRLAPFIIRGPRMDKFSRRMTGVLSWLFLSLLVPLSSTLAQVEGPALAFSQGEENQYRLKWPVTQIDYVLEVSEELFPQPHWHAFSGSGRVESGYWLVDLLPESHTLFFRLHSLDVGTLPDPSTLAPPLNPTQITDLGSATAFLYDGLRPLQLGVTEKTILPARAAVVRGRVSASDGAPLAGVWIRIHNHPEYGRTRSRSDGGYDLAVNGGGLLTVQYELESYCPAQRQLNVHSQDFNVIDEVVLLKLDPRVTEVALGSNAPLQVHEGTSQTDEDGTRHAAIILPPSTTARLIKPDGSFLSTSSLHVRATEFTVGARGPRAMPANLPPNSAYTYCVDLTADEAVSIEASEVRFDEPVFFYVENFLNFDVGIDVPSGFYNRQRAVWEAGPSGKIIRIISVTGGLADLDLTGDNVPDAGALLAAVGITDPERGQLASMYSVGQSLWRIPIPHFSSWDFNWPFGPPNDATPPNPPPPTSGDKPINHPDDPPRVLIQPQVLTSRVSVAGTPYTLNYRSDRVAGRRAAQTIQIPLSGDTTPASLKRIKLEVSVAGRVFNQDFPGTPAQTTSFEWDGIDAYGRRTYGRQPATVRIGWVYDGSYQRSTRFGYNGNGIVISGDRTREEVTLWNSATVFIGAFDIRESSLGGWTLDMHHIYDPFEQRLQLGDGTSRNAGSINGIIHRFVGGLGPFGPGFTNHGIPALSARLHRAAFCTSGPDGSIYITDAGQHQIYRVDTEQILHTIAGVQGSAGYNGDEQPAVAALLNSPFGIAVSPDGTIYFNDGLNFRTRSITPDGIIHTVAGVGSQGYAGDGGPATSAQLRACINLSRSEDGSLLISDSNNHVIRRLGTDGIITTLAGSGARGFSGDGGPATFARLGFPLGAVMDRDGSLYVVDSENRRIRRVRPDGIITTIAGDGTGAATPLDAAGDGGPARLAQLGLSRPGFNLDLNGLRLDQHGNLYFTDGGVFRIRRISREGIITSVAGSGYHPNAPSAPNGDGGAALQGGFGPTDVEVTPDGSLLITDEANAVIRKVSPPLPGFTGADILIPSEDGLQLYHFDSTGRHLATLSTLTAARLFDFEYDAAGRLSNVSDAFGNTTRIQRTASGSPTAITSPYGQTTGLRTDAARLLSEVRDPAGGIRTFSYSDDGLLESETHPSGHRHQFTYDNLGRITRSEAPNGARTDLTRVELSNGYLVTTKSSLGAQASYRVESSATGDELRESTNAVGLVTMSIRRANGTETSRVPNGTRDTRTLAPDPRFALQVLRSGKHEFTTPGDRSLTLESSLSTTLSDPNDPLSLAKSTELITVNHQVFTRLFDAASLTFTNVTAMGRQSTLTIDQQERPVAAAVRGVPPIRFSYEQHGRLSQITHGTAPDIRTMTFEYDAAGRLDQVTDPLGRSTRFEHDAMGRTTRRVLATGESVRFEYDLQGRPISVTPPGRPPHRMAYSQSDHIAEYTPPTPGAAEARTRFEEDAHGDLARVIRPDGEAIRYSRDPARRLTSVTMPGRTNTLRYDASTGHLTRIASSDGIILNYQYDGGLVTGVTSEGAVTGSVDYRYDENLRVGSIGVNGADFIDYRYDADGLLTNTGPLRLVRDPDSGRLLRTQAGVVETLYDYNIFGEPTNYLVTVNGEMIFALGVQLDALSRITATTEERENFSATKTFSYDAIGQLTNVAGHGAASYVYDPNGNRITALHPDREDSTYDAQDRLLTRTRGALTDTCEYSLSGELTSIISPSGRTTYQYDGLGNLVGARLSNGDHIEYLLDGQNRRVGKRLNGQLQWTLLYQDELKPAAQLDASGQVISRFIYTGSLNRPALLLRGNTTCVYVCDTRGSPRMLIDSATGEIAQILEYDAFGRIIADTKPGFQPFGFAGGLYDPDIETVHFGTRDYLPSIGRWVTRDPVLFRGLDLNLYRYVYNDPINRFDPYGREYIHVNFSGDILNHASITVDNTVYGFHPTPSNLDEAWAEGFSLLPFVRTRGEFSKEPSTGKTSVPIYLSDEQMQKLKDLIEKELKKGRTQPFSFSSYNCASKVKELLGKIGLIVPDIGPFPAQLEQELRVIEGLQNAAFNINAALSGH